MKRTATILPMLALLSAPALAEVSYDNFDAGNGSRSMKIASLYGSIVAAVVCAVFSIALGTSASGELPSLDVWLESPQDSYVYCSDPSLYLFVVNQGRDTAAVPYVSDHCMRYVELTIVDQDGRKLPHTGSFDNDRYDDVILVPGDTCMFTIRLLEEYALRPVPWKSYPPSVPLGTYTAYAVYWDSFPAQSVSFEIRSLSQAEEETISRYLDVRFSRTHGLERLNACTHLFERYCDTPFGPRIAYHVMTLSLSNNASDSSQIRYVMRFLDLYPENGNASVAYMRLMNLLGDEGFTQLMRSRRSLLENRYSRFLFKQAAHELGKGHLVEEVMRDEKDE